MHRPSRISGQRADVRRLASAALSCCALLWVTSTGWAQAAQENSQSPSLPVQSVDPLDDRIPDDYIGQMRVDVVGQKDRLDITAVVDVWIHRGAGWHEVDLRLPQANFSTRKYEGPGDEAPDAGTASGELAGQRWKFRGLGKHQLTLQGWIPGPGDGPGGQFQLNLPQLPPGFGTQLTVRIPRADIAVRPHETLSRLEVFPRNGETEVHASALGTSVTFAWQSPRQGVAVGAVHSEIAVQPERGRLTLLVDQALTIEQPGVNQVDVRLPDDFRLIRVTGDKLRNSTPLPDRPGWTRLELVTTAPERVQLQWVLERMLPGETAVVSLAGFEIAGVPQQTGLIRIGSFENSRIIPALERSEKVLQVDAQQAGDIGGRLPVLAYEYRQQPFRLAFELAPVTPFFVSNPRYELDFRQDQVQLTAEFPLQFERGGISELRCDWAGFNEEGWQVTGVEGPSGDLGLVSLDESTQAGVLRFFWRDVISSDALVRLTCVRPLPQRPAQDLALSFPVPRTSQFNTAELTVRREDSLEVRMSREQGAGWTAMETAADRAAAPRPVDHDLLSRYRLDDPYERVLAGLTVHPLRLSATSVINILEASNREIVVQQSMQLNIQYGRITELQLLLPPALGIREWELNESLDVRLSTAPETALPLDPQGRVRFPYPVRGTPELRIGYRFPLSTALRIVECDVPILRLTFPFDRVTCQIANPDLAEVRTNQSRWEPVPISQRRGLWICPHPDATLANVPLLVGGSLSNPSEPYAVRQLSARTWLTDSGAAESVAEIQLQSRPSRIVCLFPLDVQVNLDAVRVDGLRVQAELLSETRSGPQALTIPIPREGRAAPRVALRFRQPAQPLDWRSIQTVSLPEFDLTTWVERTDWDLLLPGQHLLLRSPRLTPRFHWTHRLNYAGRVSGEPGAGSALNFADQAAEGAAQEGLAYGFTGDGPATEVTFQTMDRSLVILLGAGGTLLLGYLCGQFPLTRSFSCAAGLGLAISVAALWFDESLLVFLPPAALGLGLALLALWLESPRGGHWRGWAARRQVRPFLASRKESSRHAPSTRSRRPSGIGSAAEGG